MKRLIYLLFILLLMMVSVACSQTTTEITAPITTLTTRTTLPPTTMAPTTTTTLTPTTTTQDMSWKIVYDAVETSPYFLDTVSACYQIFPISFADSNQDGYGDINGITENILYLKDTLGVDCVWINPVNPSPSYHKYDVTDYYGIDPQLGTMADYEALLDVAETNGIKVLMDLVINHSSFNHPWFVDSRSQIDSEYRDYYMWNDLSNKTLYPSKTNWYFYGSEYYYASFWDQMPEFNFDNPDVRQEMKDIAEFWLEKGVDGFRIDAAKHIYNVGEYPSGYPTLAENVNFFKEFNAFIKSVNPNAFMVGEVADVSATYIARYYEGMDSAFNFAYAADLIQALQNTYDNGVITDLITARNAYALKRASFIDSLFLSNHDQIRIMDALGQDEDKTKLAMRILFTLPGISWIYYGEELGMTGVKPDESIRQPFKWGYSSEYNTTGKPGGISGWNSYNQVLPGVIEQDGVDGSMLDAYQEMIALKKNDSVLRQGDLQTVLKSDSGIIAFVREYEETKYLVIHNLSINAKVIAHNLSGYELIYESGGWTAGETDFNLPGRASLIVEFTDTDVQLGNQFYHVKQKAIRNYRIAFKY